MSYVNHPNVREASADEPGAEDLVGEVSHTEKTIRDKIIHTLTIYPQISPSMLQVGIGTAMPPTIWKPIMTQMEEEGVIKRHSVQSITPTNRVQVYTVLSLGLIEPKAE